MKYFKSFVANVRVSQIFIIIYNKGSQNFFDKYLFRGHTFCSTNPLMTNTFVNLSFYETVMRIMM